MRVRALRGVCIGVNRNLAVGEVAEIDATSVPFLVNIRAVEIVKDDPPPVSETITPAKVGKAKEY